MPFRQQAIILIKHSKKGIIVRSKPSKKLVDEERFTNDIGGIQGQDIIPCLTESFGIIRDIGAGS